MMRSTMRIPANAAMKATAMRSFSAAPVSDFGKVRPTTAISSCPDFT